MNCLTCAHLSLLMHIIITCPRALNPQRPCDACPVFSLLEADILTDRDTRQGTTSARPTTSPMSPHIGG